MSASSSQTRWARTEPGHSGEDSQDEVQLSLVARLPEIVARAAWKHRWRLAPAYLCAAAVIAAANGLAGALIGVLAGGAGVLEATARTKITIGGRMLLSIRERRLAATGLAVTAAWAGLTLLVPALPWLADALILWGSLAVPSMGWWASRRPVPPPPSLLSPLAQQVLDGWATDISVGEGPRALRGSLPVPDTITEPADGALVMNVQLARGVHARDAATSTVRQSIEALFGLGEDTVRVETVREDSTQVRVLLTPSRHLDTAEGMPWQGPILTEDGRIPLADCADGTTADIPLHDDSGVKHGFITGTAGAGKSVTSAAVILPGVVAGLEIVFYCDGKHGTSAAKQLDPALTRMAVNPQQWKAMIELVYRIMTDRKTRRGQARLTKWQTGIEDDPIICLFIDEATTVNEKIDGKHVRMVEEIAREGRALGVRLIQATQSPSFEHLIGGVAVRNLLTSAGWAICHRAGGSGASRLTLDSASGVDVDLRGLLAGQAAILVEGRLAAFPARVRWAHDDTIAAALDGHVTRQLTGADLEAAGPAYDQHNWAPSGSGHNSGQDSGQDPGQDTSSGDVPAWEIPQPTQVTASSASSGSSFPPVYGQDGNLELTGEDFEAINRAWVLQALYGRGPMSRSALAQVVAGPDLLDPVLEGLVTAELILRGGDQYVLAPVTASPEGSRILSGIQQIFTGAGLPIPAWARRQDLSEPGPIDPVEPVEPAREDDLPASRRWVLDQLAAAPEGMTLKQLQDKQLQDLAGGLSGAPARRTISNALADLMARRAVSKNGAVWTIATPEEDDAEFTENAY